MMSQLDGRSLNGHAEGTSETWAFLTCTNALPEKWKVGGSTPPLPTAESRRPEELSGLRLSSLKELL